jgi:hypothetical protein
MEIANGSLWHRLIELYDHGHLLGAGSPAGSDTDVSNMVS